MYVYVCILLGPLAAVLLFESIQVFLYSSNIPISDKRSITLSLSLLRSMHVLNLIIGTYLRNKLNIDNFENGSYTR